MPKTSSARHFPLFVDLSGTAVLVVGAGQVAARKIAGLLHSAATITVVAPQANRQIRKWSSAKRLRWLERPVRPGDLKGAKLVICATGHLEVDRKLSLAARRQGLLVNCASAPDLGNVLFPAIARKDPVQVAVSTGGASPAFARKLADEITGSLGIKTVRWANLLRQLRPLVIAQVPKQLRPTVWKHLTADKLGEMISRGKMPQARKFARAKIETASKGSSQKRRASTN